MQHNKRISLPWFLVGSLVCFAGVALVTRALALLHIFPAAMVAEMVIGTLAYVATFVFATLAIKYSQYAKKLERLNPQLSDRFKVIENKMYWAVFISFLIWLPVFLSFTEFAKI